MAPTSSQPHAPMTIRFGRTTVSVITGDVFSAGAEAIVVPANRRGMMVAGVAGHVRLRGGVEIERDIMQQAPLTMGTSVATSAGALTNRGTRMVLHAVVFDDLGGTARLDVVERAVASVLESADRHRVRSIVIPPIGAGVGQGRLTQDDVYTSIVNAVAAHLRRFSSRVDTICVACSGPKEAKAVFGKVQQAHSLWWQLRTTR